MKPGETIGGAQFQLVGAIATYTVGRSTGNRRIQALGSDLVRANIVAQSVTQGIKLAVGRTRPDGTQYSFPSGHTSVTFATATVLQRHFGWKAGVPAYALASYVAASRVQAKRHFFSDVAFGASIGIVAGRTVTIGRGSTRFAVSPSVSKGSAGISFDLVNQH
jgi:membrane-associated phospholipid phosphatase